MSQTPQTLFNKHVYSLKQTLRLSLDDFHLHNTCAGEEVSKTHLCALLEAWSL